jgi:nucleoside-diphosphate-sugar epimerase
MTGGSGKVGTYVVKELVDGQHEVCVFDRVRPQNDQVRWIQGNIEDFGDVLSAFVGADAVIHLAAYPIPYRQIPNHSLFRNNVMGAFNVYEAASCLGIRRVVSTSSVAALGYPYYDQVPIPKYFPIDEKHPLMAQDPYGIGKICEENMARAYSAKCGMQTVVLRPDRVLLPEIYPQLRERGGLQPRKFELCGYTDVRDLAVAYRQAVELPNLLYEVCFVVADDSTVAEPLCEVLPRFLPAIRESANVLTGSRSSISNSKAKQVLGWNHRHSWRNQD